MISITYGENTIYCVDPQSVMRVLGEAYSMSEWLRRVNSLDLRTDNVLGKGYFLVTKTDYVAIRSYLASEGSTGSLLVTFGDHAGTAEYIVYLEDGVTIDHYVSETVTSPVTVNGSSSDIDTEFESLVVMIVREERNILQNTILQDDYNVIDVNTFKDYNNFAVYLPQTERVGTVWGFPKTWAQILDRIATLTGLTLIYDGSLPATAPYNVFLAGLNALEALSLIGQAFGCGVTVRSGEIYFFSRDNSAILPENCRFVEDNVGAAEVPQLRVQYPVFNQHMDNQMIRDKYHSVHVLNDTILGGYTSLTYCPFHPYIIGESGNNSSALASVDTLITTRFNALYAERVSKYEVQAYDNSTSKFDKTVLFDDGLTYGTIYISRPFEEIDTPISVETSQSIQPFKWEITTAVDVEGDPTTGRLKIYRPYDGAEWVSSLAFDKVIPLAGTLIGKTVGTTGFGVRVGTLRYVTVTADSGAEFYTFTLTSDLAATPGSTATANYTKLSDLTTGTFTVVHYHKFRTFSGAKGLAVKINSEYFIIYVEMPVQRLRCFIADNPDTSIGSPKYGADPREGTAYINAVASRYKLSSFPYTLYHLTTDLEEDGTIHVANPNLLMGEKDDQCIIEWNNDLDRYELMQVFPQRQLWMNGYLASDRISGLDKNCSVAVVAGFMSHGASPSTPITALDWFNVAVNGKAEHDVIIAWLPDQQKYFVIQARHTATRVKGTLSSVGFSGTPSSFSVDVVAGMNGPAPNGPLTVKNRYSWDKGTGGHNIEVLWDTVAAEWYPAQMRYSC